jgi:hypothetical protein
MRLANPHADQLSNVVLLADRSRQLRAGQECILATDRATAEGVIAKGPPRYSDVPDATIDTADKL